MDSVYSHPHLLLSRYLRPWLILFNHRLPPICNSVCSTRAPGFAASSRAAKLCLMVPALWIQCTALLRHLAISLLILSLLFISKRPRCRCRLLPARRICSVFYRLSSRPPTLRRSIFYGRWTKFGRLLVSSCALVRSTPRWCRACSSAACSISPLRPARRSRQPPGRP